MEDAQVNSLIDRARDGDAAAWSQLFTLCQDRLLSDAQRLLGSNWPHISPRDLTQDTWLQAKAHLHRYRGAGFQAWLSAIMRNRYLNLIRGKTTALPAATAADLDPAADDLSVLHEMLNREQAAVLARAVSELDAHQRDLLKLRMDDGLSFVEMGARLGLSEKVARTRFHDVIRVLRRKLQELRE